MLKFRVGVQSRGVAIFAIGVLSALFCESVSLGASAPWAPNTTFSSATAGIGVDPSGGVQAFGSLVTFYPTALSSFATTTGTTGSAPVWSYAGTGGTTLFSGSGYSSFASTNGTIYNLYPGSGTTDPNWVAGQAYPAGAGTVPAKPTPGVQPLGLPFSIGTLAVAGTGKNVSNLVFPVASSVVLNSGTSATTDSYPIGPKLNLTNGAFNPGANGSIIAGTFVPQYVGAGISMTWRTRSQGEMKSGLGQNEFIGNTAFLASDVVKVDGQLQGYDYVMQMDFSNEVETPGDAINDINVKQGLFLGALGKNPAGPNGGSNQWLNAVTLNVSQNYATTVYDPRTRRYSTINRYTPKVGAFSWNGTGAGDGRVASDKPFLGSFQSFLETSDGLGGHYYDHSLDQLRGTWGVDLSTDTAWSVLDVGSGVFAVVPEPSTARLFAAGLLCVGIYVWRRRRARVAASVLAA